MLSNGGEGVLVEVINCKQNCYEFYDYHENEMMMLCCSIAFILVLFSYSYKSGHL